MTYKASGKDVNIFGNSPNNNLNPEKSQEINITLEYPYNDSYDYTTRLERINLDKQKNEDIIKGKGFIISAPKSIKKDVKNQDGIFSSRYGSNSINDTDSFNGRYRCKCGLKRGSFLHGELCTVCNTRVEYLDDDVSISGFLVLKDKYWIIHPNIYRTLEAFIGALRLERILTPAVEVDSNGKEIDKRNLPPVKKDEPFRNIGMEEFRLRFKEVMDFYYSKYPSKKIYYDDIMEQYNLGNVFTHTINVYSSLLRPSRIDNGSLRYEACNEWFNMLSKLVHTCNDDELHMNQKMKEKLQLLWDIQKNLNAVYTELKEILSKKKGDFRSAIGGRLNFTERSVIRQDVTLKADQIKLPFHGLCELLQQVIINILVKSYQFSYAEAYKKWYKAQITGNDRVVYDIVEGLIHDADGGGLPIIINRNPKIVGDIVETQCR
jgi:hypothetical protein